MSKIKINNTMNKNEQADQLELAARIIREGLEWEHLVDRHLWTKGGSVMYCVAQEIPIRIKEQPKLKRVPLGPEDVPPGSVLMAKEWSVGWLAIIEVTQGWVLTPRFGMMTYNNLMDDEWKIKRPGQDWMPCWKEVAE